MANFNKVILLGNLTRDPQLSYLPSNMPVIEFGMAINRRWKGQDGQMKEEVCFVDCRCYGRSAETINQYVKKGRPLLVEGHLRFDAWETKEGQKRSRLWVIVDQFQFIDSRRDESGAPPPGPRPERNNEYAAPQPAPAEEMAPGGEHVPF